MTISNSFKGSVSLEQVSQELRSPPTLRISPFRIPPIAVFFDIDGVKADSDLPHMAPHPADFIRCAHIDLHGSRIHKAQSVRSRRGFAARAIRSRAFRAYDFAQLGVCKRRVDERRGRCVRQRNYGRTFWQPARVVDFQVGSWLLASLFNARLGAVSVAIFRRFLQVDGYAECVCARRRPPSLGDCGRASRPLRAGASTAVCRCVVGRPCR
jgi:hypothetical protein